VGGKKNGVGPYGGEGWEPCVLKGGKETRRTTWAGKRVPWLEGSGVVLSIKTVWGDRYLRVSALKWFLRGKWKN